MNPTKLLVLGVVRLFEPVHGYQVRRELLSWRAENWANLNPGSIYHALKRLARDGLIDEADADVPSGGPSKTTYQVTEEGRFEFAALLREHLWEVVPNDPTGLLAALSFLHEVDRAEVVAALEQRAAVLEGELTSSRFAREEAQRASTVPDHVTEIFLLTDERVGGELAWTRGFLDRLATGAYHLRSDAHRE